MEIYENVNYISELCRFADNAWNPSIIKDIRRAIAVTKKYVNMNYSDKNISISQIIDEFNVRMARNFDSRIVYSGYSYESQAVKDFYEHPEVFWETYEKAKDKDEFLCGAPEIYGTDRKRNLELFVQNMFEILSDDNGVRKSSREFDLMHESQRQTVVNNLINHYKKEYKNYLPVYENPRIIKSLQNTIKELDDFGVLGENLSMYNELMRKNGLEGLITSETPEGKTDDLIGVFSKENLSALSYYQLQGLLSFYLNRIGKIEEQIGRGLFFMVAGEVDSNSQKDLTDDELKNIWKEFFIFNKILEDKRKVIDEECTRHNVNGIEKLCSFSEEDIYKVIYKEYEEFLSKYIGGKRDVKKDCISCIKAMSFLKLNNYKLKDVVLEDIIIQSSKSKLNWGYIEEDGKSRLSKFMLIGVDVPGLSMPLRLHIRLDRLKNIMKNFLETDEIPVYIGKEDFEKYGNKMGTPLILPIFSKQRDEIKKIARREEKRMKEVAKTSKVLDENTSLVRHLACTQLPNPIEKLLKWKTRGEKKYQDYINLDTGKIRRVENIEISKR